MGTAARLEFGLYDTSAKTDATASSGNVKPFVDLASLREEGLTAPIVATLERDLFLLDGGMELPPDTGGQPWGYWSASMSDVSGVFAAPPILTINFAQNHASLGLTMRFYEPTNDYPSEIAVRWYDSGGYIITQGVYYPTGPEWMLESKAEGYRRIELEFRRTSKPRRYAKLTEIRYGATKIFSGDALMSASVLEEADPLSAEIRVNTLDFKLHSEDSEFSVLNPQGVFSLLQQGQRVDAYVTQDGEDIPMGAYYLDDWRNEDDATITMRAVDIVGKSGGADFAGGMYSGVTASVLLAEIMAGTGIKYALDPSLTGSLVSGWLPMGTVRDALQQLAFAVGAVVDCSRSDTVRLYPMPQRPTSLITGSRKFLGQTVDLRPLVTGVDVVAHNYVPSTTAEQILQDTLPAGQYDIAFSAPMHSLSVTGAAITESNANHALLTVSSPGAVTLTGKPYTDSSLIVRKRTPDLPPASTPNVLQVKEATLVGLGNASEVAQRVYDYHQQRYIGKFNMVGGAEKLCDMVLVESIRRERLRGAMESMRIDLTGGYLAEVSVVGIRIETINAYRAGELYSGENMGVI